MMRISFANCMSRPMFGSLSGLGALMQQAIFFLQWVSHDIVLAGTVKTNPVG